MHSCQENINGRNKGGEGGLRDSLVKLSEYRDEIVEFNVNKNYSVFFRKTSLLKAKQKQKEIDLT